MSADFATQAPAALLGPGMGLLTPLFPDSPDDNALLLGLDALCFTGLTPGNASPFALFGMWSLMALGMMVPTAVPMLRTYNDLATENPVRISSFGFWGLLTGFSFV